MMRRPRPRCTRRCSRTRLASRWPGRGTHCTGSVALPLGLLAAVLGDDERAERHLDDAVSVNDALGARPFAAAARYGSPRSSSVAGSASARQSSDPRRSASADELGMTLPQHIARYL